ncbi:trypsin-like serine peptidase [Rhizobium leguminosarum]|uniref:trypsin-like serine peptidase n=1 Tax=Rhizobium leguminosarum TaxID=384 RepID=UPI0010312609|nr:trypsin-like peptidase domain-containing protein [Rhizobium leguminosarum]TAV89299.1 serine protease [Rhizobium leguminosarum]TAV93880.1 serine protease [Rhizobium leguminosarum]TAW34957.1 serine protease [Rhizobium leguminosarum]
MGIEIQSVQSLFIEMYFNDTRLSSGTGFLVQAPRSLVLITNRHNVTGRRQDDNQPLSDNGGIPNKIRVWRNAAGNTGGWRPFEYSLYDNDENPQWMEHPTMGSTADFVALPVDTPFDVVNYPYATSVPEKQLLIRPAETVSVVGFPFGQAAGGLFGVWVSGFIASEPDVNFNGLPQFLVDCRTRPGQSGSPVIAVRRGSATFKNGSTEIGRLNFAELLGIYSGRINDKSDIGIVWKRAAIDELVQSITPLRKLP